VSLGGRPAAWVFLNAVVTTSPDGAGAASKADWRPLAGRRVMIWPDADEPGEKYAASVAAILHGQGCDVSIIDTVALAGMSPDGGSRDPSERWDAADAVAEWQDITALRKAAHGLARPYAGEATSGNETLAGLATLAGGHTNTEIPLPLFPPLAEAEPYPADALGKTLSRAAKAIASKAQVPIAMAAQSVLAVA